MNGDEGVGKPAGEELSGWAFAAEDRLAQAIAVAAQHRQAVPVRRLAAAAAGLPSPVAPSALQAPAPIGGEFVETHRAERGRPALGWFSLPSPRIGLAERTARREQEIQAHGPADPRLLHDLGPCHRFFTAPSPIDVGSPSSS
jgi:hypothetical protein